MHAEPFRADAGGPDLLIDRADDGTPLVDGRGWSCDNCGTLYAGRNDADVCCIEPDAVVIAGPALASNPSPGTDRAPPLRLPARQSASRPG